jgi:hypothetical protein
MRKHPRLDTPQAAGTAADTAAPPTVRSVRHRSVPSDNELSRLIKSGFVAWVEQTMANQTPDRQPAKAAAKAFASDTDWLLADLVEHLDATFGTHGSLVFVAVRVIMARLEVRIPGIMRPLNICRMLAVLTVIASKVEFDNIYSMHYYSECVGVTHADLVALEWRTCFLLDFEVLCNPKDIRTAWPGLCPHLEAVEAGLKRRPQLSVL